jgi:hypothetical protein
LHGVVFEGWGLAAVVADAVPLAAMLETGSPAMAVRSSVVDGDEDEGVVVAFCALEIIIADVVTGEDAGFVDIALLG